ncbi:hypothetical protein [Pedobacter sp. L105]|uniref:hypothetical protein n=1 Tax=Pedobacter sp. L105 TaxID=1641871 RepID=UPI00131BFA7F|nr:hypothetical protein [Pedobacter sp. L105]
MKTDAENNEWKAEAPYLASLPIQNPFLIPEQYFNSLPDLINSSVYFEELKDAIPASGFTVPSSYFSDAQSRFAKAIASDIDDEEADEAITFSLPKADGYTTPDLYFETLSSRILEKTTGHNISGKKSSKIVRLWHSGLLKYASAACFVLVSTFGLYINHQRESMNTEVANEQMLYDIDEQDIIDNIQGTNVDAQSTNTTNTDLETYILNNYSQSDLSSAL